MIFFFNVLVSVLVVLQACGGPAKGSAWYGSLKEKNIVSRFWPSLSTEYFSMQCAALTGKELLSLRRACARQVLKALLCIYLETNANESYPDAAYHTARPLNYLQ